ncbi:MAG TPA: DUF3857 domain-containing protein [Terracidiphilus sp.]|nr:DUF3857 domain-containing protein [Terracidiphilus sp.]
MCGLGWVAPARAQFEAPNPEELKMTADPKAPGADAVYLYREEIADDRRSVYSLYERIKILTEKGRDLATVKIPYEKGMINVTGIEGRTIHADGTVVPLTEKPENLVAVKTKGYQENTIVFTLPSVETGSILEYRLQMRYNESLLLPPSWDIQQAYYVHKAHYEFYPGRTGQFGPSRLMWVLTPRDAKVAIVQGKGVFTIDVADVPPVPDDDWMPPLNTFREHVQFYYSYASSGDEFWRNAGNFWASSLDQFIKPSVKLKSIVEGIVAAGDTDEQKAREIYAAVIRLENTMLSGEKTEAERKKEKIKEIRSAEDVWRDQGGTANQIALLYVALARAAGLKAWPMFIAPRDERIFDPTYFYMDQLSDYIVVLDLGGRTVYLDPGQKTCSFGQLAWMHTLAGGLRMNENGARIDYTPAANYRDNSTERTANLAVDATGIVTGQVRVFFSGDEAAYWRQVALENGAGELEKQITGSLQDDLPDGVNASFDHFVSLDDYESRMMAVFRVSGTMGSPEGKYFILPGLFFESRAKVPFVAQSSRTTPIDLHFPMMETDEVDYTLPPGYTVESSPEFPDLTWPRYAVMRIDSGTGNGELTVKRMFARDFAFLGPESYSDLRGFYQKVAAADQQQIVLTRAAAQKGN